MQTVFSPYCLLLHYIMPFLAQSFSEPLLTFAVRQVLLVPVWTWAVFPGTSCTKPLCWEKPSRMPGSTACPMARVIWWRRYINMWSLWALSWGGSWGTVMSPTWTPMERYRSHTLYRSARGRGFWTGACGRSPCDGAQCRGDQGLCCGSEVWSDQTAAGHHCGTPPCLCPGVDQTDSNSACHWRHDGQKELLRLAPCCQSLLPKATVQIAGRSLSEHFHCCVTGSYQLSNDVWVRRLIDRWAGTDAAAGPRHWGHFLFTWFFFFYLVLPY